MDYMDITELQKKKVNIENRIEALKVRACELRRKRNERNFDVLVEASEPVPSGSTKRDESIQSEAANEESNPQLLERRLAAMQAFSSIQFTDVKDLPDNFLIVKGECQKVIFTMDFQRRKENDIVTYHLLSIKITDYNQYQELETFLLYCMNGNHIQLFLREIEVYASLIQIRQNVLDWLCTEYETHFLYQPMSDGSGMEVIAMDKETQLEYFKTEWKIEFTKPYFRTVFRISTHSVPPGSGYVEPIRSLFKELSLLHSSDESSFQVILKKVAEFVIEVTERRSDELSS